LTFKEDCPDLRNSKVIDIIRELESYGARVHVHDPIADADEAMHEYGVTLTPWNKLPRAHAIVAAVAHKPLVERYGADLSDKLGPDGVFVDVKGKADAQALRARGYTVWRL
jgi:UDP-N-acetyl-D-galactosamine dehydrogenase